MNTLALYAVVSISGAAVLAVEILGTRILGPFYGMGLFLWSALISVTLAALAAGYALGGRWADRGPVAARLALLLAGAGAWLIVVPWLRHPLLAATSHLGLRAAVLVTSTLLFFPPLALLGMVSPYAIRLRARRLDEVGRTAGDLFAVSTVASVVAALATGFWLVPMLGVARLTGAVAIALFVASGIAWAASRQGRAPIVPLLLAVLAGLAAISIARPGAAAGEGLVFRGESPYAEIRVLDRGDVRYLLIDGGVHTAIEKSTGRPLHPYVVVADLAQELFTAPGRMLLIGLGGGSAAESFAWRGWQVEAVEIDPLVRRVAHDWFGLREDVVPVTQMDGRRFLRTMHGEKDVIFFDAYGSSAIPFHLITDEAFALAKSHLAPGGMLVLNLESVGWHHPIVKSVAATLRRRFSTVVALPIAEPPTRRGNVIIFAADRPLAIPDSVLGRPRDALSDDYEHWRVLQRNHAWDNRFEPAAEGARILTDDLNPVDLWAEDVNRVARRELHQLFAHAPGW